MYCVWSHSSLSVTEHKLTNAARMLMNSAAAEPGTNTNTHFLPPEGGEGGDARGLGGGHTELPSTSVHLTQKHFTVPELFMSEDLGVSPVKTCVKCKNCPDCDFRTYTITRDEAAVVEKV